MPTILCIASFFKGNDFIRECRRQGARVALLTREKLLNEQWARDAIDDLVAIPGRSSVAAYLMAATDIARHHQIRRVGFQTRSANPCRRRAGEPHRWNADVERGGHLRARPSARSIDPQRIRSHRG